VALNRRDFPVVSPPLSGACAKEEYREETQLRDRHGSIGRRSAGQKSNSRDEKADAHR